MVFKKVITAASAVALIAAPTVAVAQRAAPTVAAAQVEPASETVEGSELRGGFIIPLIALIAIILGLCAATELCGGDDEDPPHSP